MVMGCARQPAAGVEGDPLARSHQDFRAAKGQGAGAHGCCRRCGGVWGYQGVSLSTLSAIFRGQRVHGVFVFPL